MNTQIKLSKVSGHPLCGSMSSKYCPYGETLVTTVSTEKVPQNKSVRPSSAHGNVAKLENVENAVFFKNTALCGIF